METRQQSGMMHTRMKNERAGQVLRMAASSLNSLATKTLRQQLTGPSTCCPFSPITCTVPAAHGPFHMLPFLSNHLHRCSRPRNTHRMLADYIVQVLELPAVHVMHA